MAFLIRTDGTIDEVRPANGEVFTLEELQKLVGGYIELVPMHTGGIMLIDEEGKLKGKPYNEQATERYLHGKYDRIVGDAVIVSYREAGERDRNMFDAEQEAQAK